MSDRFPVQIEIGGQLKSSQIQKLIDAINSEELSLEWGEGPIKFTDKDSLINSMSKFDTHIVLMDDERAWGDIESLEETCRNLHLTWKTTVGPRYEYNGSLRYYNPIVGLIELECDVDGYPIASKEDLKEILNYLKETKLGNIGKAIKKLEYLTQDFIVPKFEIVGENSV